MSGFAFDLQKVARKNILELTPYRCARDVRRILEQTIYLRIYQ